MKLHYTVLKGEEQCPVTLTTEGDGRYQVAMGEETITLDARELSPGELHLLDEDRSLDLLVEGKGPELVVHRAGQQVRVVLLDERQAARSAAAGFGPRRGADGLVAILAPMPGKVVKCLLGKGEAVTAGQGVIIVEAMKMENELRSPVDGLVKDIRVVEGQNVEAGEELAVIE